MNREWLQAVAGLDDLAIDGAERDSKVLRIRGGQFGNVIGDVTVEPGCQSAVQVANDLPEQAGGRFHLPQQLVHLVPQTLRHVGLPFDQSARFMPDICCAPRLFSLSTLACLVGNSASGIGFRDRA